MDKIIAAMRRSCGNQRLLRPLLLTIALSQPVVAAVEDPLEMEDSAEISQHQHDEIQVPMEDVAPGAGAETLTDPGGQELPETPVGEVAEETAGERAEVSPDVTPTDPIKEYMDAIETVEISRGAYSLELADLYLGLGNLLLRDQKFLEAKDVFQKGMQVTRINNGLEDLSQEPFLYSLADLDIAIGDPDASNSAMHHILQINSETHGVENERMLPALNRMLEWYLDRYQLLGPREAFQYLLNAEQLASHMVTIHRDTLEHFDDGAPDAYRKLSAVEFALARHVDTHGLPGQQEGFAYSFGAPQNQLPPEPAYIDRYYRAGRDALKMSVGLLNEQPGVNKRELAEAVAELADWYAAFDKYLAAQEHYQLAYQLLGESDDSREFQDTFFAHPRLITFRREDSAADIADQGGEGLAVTLDISDRGVPGNLRLEDRGDEVGVRQIRQIKKEVLRFRFRPQLEQGVLVGTKDYVYRYPLNGLEKQHES